VFELTRRLGIEKNVIFPGFVPAALLPALYAKAACFIFPSLYEGFGLPALEAASCGTPVVTSNVTSLPEIMGDAAICVNPESVLSITSGIETVLTNDIERQRLIIAGKERAQKFNWQDTAKQHLAVYEKVRF
jgi:glycosyltransferase involved in cell wall biosynthesis